MVTLKRQKRTFSARDFAGLSRSAAAEAGVLSLFLGLGLWKDGGQEWLRLREAKPFLCPVWSRRMGPQAWTDRRNPHGKAGVRLSAFTRASSGAGSPRSRSVSTAASCGSQYSA